jgi:hypothetical protein
MKLVYSAASKYDQLGGGDMAGCSQQQAMQQNRRIRANGNRMVPLNDCIQGADSI